MDLWDEWDAMQQGRTPSIPADLELEAPPTTHPVPLQHARDATPGEAVTLATLDGTLRDMVLVSATDQDLQPLGDTVHDLPEEVRSTPTRAVCSRELWVHHRYYPEQFPRVGQLWPVTHLWVWRDEPTPAADDVIPERFEWMRRAMQGNTAPQPRVPMRVQDAGALTGREVTVRNLLDDGPGPWHTQVAVGEIEDGPEGYVVPCQPIDSYESGALSLTGHQGVNRYPVHRVWVRA